MTTENESLAGGPVCCGKAWWGALPLFLPLNPVKRPDEISSTWEKSCLNPKDSTGNESPLMTWWMMSQKGCKTDWRMPRMDRQNNPRGAGRP